MIIIVVSCVYPPEPVVSAQTSTHVAEALALSGHKVKVITSFPSRPSGRLYPGYRRRLTSKEVTPSGLIINRCFSTLSPKSSMISRLVENLSFGVTGGWHVMTMPKPNVIYANTWPIVAIGILSLIARIRRVPLVISLQDIYPESLIAQKRIKTKGTLACLLRLADVIIARWSSQIIVISERIARVYRNGRGVPAERISLIPNWIDTNQINVNVEYKEYRRSRVISDQDFLIVYGGNIGVAAGVETVVEAIRLLDEPRVRLLIAGSGSRLESCRLLANTIPGNRVMFHSPWSVAINPEVLLAADLLVLPTQGQQSLAALPSKLLSYMLAGRPILATALPGSDLTDLVEKAGCGWVVEPDKPDLIAEKVKHILAIDPSELRRMGENGRHYVLEHFAKEVCLPRVIDVIEHAAGH